MNNKFSCIKCGGENLSSLKVICKTGTTTMNTKTDVYRQGLARPKYTGITHVSTESTQTELAKMAQPPLRRRGTVRNFILALIFLILGLGTSRVWEVSIFVGIGIYFGWSFWKTLVYNRKTFPVLRRKWENTYFCHTCGTHNLIYEDDF